MAEVAPLTETKAPLLRRRDVAEGTVELTFDCSARPLGFAAGQYVSLIAPPEIGVDPPSDQRDLSVVSSPEVPTEVGVAYRDSDSPVKRWLRGLPLGSDVTLRGPAGSFTLPDGEGEGEDHAVVPVALLAGGIGVVPFRSMLLDPEHAGRRIGLFCWNRTPERAAYADELARLTAAAHRDLVMNVGSFEPRPLAAWHVTYPGSYWYVSGPSEMVWNALAALERLGVPKDRVRTEEFTGYENRPDG